MFHYTIVCSLLWCCKDNKKQETRRIFSTNALFYSAKLRIFAVGNIKL